MTYRALFKFDNSESTYADYRRFKIDESEQAIYEKMVDTFLQYINGRFGSYYTLEDVADYIYNDLLLDYKTDDGRPFLNYYDGDINFVVLPDRVIDDDDDLQEYNKYIF